MSTLVDKLSNSIVNIRNVKWLMVSAGFVGNWLHSPVA